MPERLFATYCSAEKNRSDAPLPAVERYISERIAGVHAMAKAAAVRFGILSGEFGLIAPDHPIPYYDRLLDRHQVESMAVSVADTLRAWDIHAVQWFSVAFEMDPNVSRYRDVMAKAAEAVGAAFDLDLWNPPGTLTGF